MRFLVDAQLPPSTNRALFSWLEPLLPAAVQDLQSGHRLVELQRQST